MAPAWKSNRSVSVVLPASMWAVMPMLRIRSIGSDRMLVLFLIWVLSCWLFCGRAAAQLDRCWQFRTSGWAAFGRNTFRAENEKALRNAQDFRKREATRETCLQNPS